MNQPPLSVTCTHIGQELTVTLGGSWHLGAPKPPSYEEALNTLATGELSKLTLQAPQLETWDSSLLVFLVQLVRIAKTRHIPINEQLPVGLQRLLTLAFEVKEQQGAKRSSHGENFFAQVGDKVIHFFPALCDLLLFLGQVVTALWHLFLGRATMRRQDFIACIHECSLQALPIVSITNLLFGLILAFVGAVQLTQFGVQVYVAGLVGIGMLRVMGAVMVGIVMAGRVGASYAALIGTMQVNEEVDALLSFGFSPVEFLVLPRMLALALMVPLLTIYADMMGILGGYLVGTLLLDLNPLEYLNATANMVDFKHGLIGLVYATMFGIVIAISGCYHGIRCGRSAQAVGIATTTAVVHSIVGIIVMTAIITIICNALGI
ncbi:MAG: ABC transporter permease [Desulfovibrionaceae bacterium]|nr:ABC transporter permease [Desulfovibrionaceae bacterium]